MSEPETKPHEPWAKRHQLVVDELDTGLVETARRTHPMATWWWGHRNTEDGNGALCYLCDCLIERWDRRWPMTEKAKHAVQEHRMTHLTKNLFDDDLT